MPAQIYNFEELDIIILYNEINVQKLNPKY
jgi:hypothetical protein